MTHILTYYIAGAPLTGLLFCTTCYIEWPTAVLNRGETLEQTLGKQANQLTVSVKELSLILIEVKVLSVVWVLIID